MAMTRWHLEVHFHLPRENNNGRKNKSDKGGKKRGKISSRIQRILVVKENPLPSIPCGRSCP